MQTDRGASPSAGELAELSYLRSAAAVRERAEDVHALAMDGKLAHFSIVAERLPALASRVVDITRATYPDVRGIPYHARWRHFGAGGVDRVGRLDDRLSTVDADERLRSKFELVMTSVLLDAGSGNRWAYVDASGKRYTRSEGLAVASFDLFFAGSLSSDPECSPLRVDAERLAAFTAEDLARAFQVSGDNPLAGLDGRASLLRNLGHVVRTTPRYFGEHAPRLGALGTYLLSRTVHHELRASTVLETLLDALGDIWPGRERCAGKNLGDVWTHPAVGRVPFHKLSQWLTYSLCEPLEERGVRIVGLDDLTGLAEYRNGGLFIDGGVLVPKDEEILTAVHAVGSSVVVEWRALTIALLDRIASEMRRILGLSTAELPLAKGLEGGTWRAGRILAAERRKGGSPPLRVQSDGTVF